MPFCFPPPGAKGEPMTRSGSPSPFRSAATSVQPKLQYVSCRGSRRARPAQRRTAGGGKVWPAGLAARGSPYLAGDGDVRAGRHSSSSGTEVDVHSTLGEGKPWGGQRQGW